MLVLGSDEYQIVSVKETERTARDYDANIEIFHSIGHFIANDVGWEVVLFFSTDFWGNQQTGAQDGSINHILHQNDP